MNMIPFEACEGTHPVQRFLSLAKLPGNCLAWLDKRGFLHLRSPLQGELSIVLSHNRPLAFWCSAGWRVGGVYDLGLETSVHTSHAADWLQAFLETVTGAAQE